MSSFVRSTDTSRTSPSRFVIQSALPVIGAGLAILVSLSLVVLSLIAARQEQIFDWLLLPIIPPELWYVPLIGYLLTPMFVIVMLGWNRVSFQRGLQDKNFVARPQYATWLQWMTGAAMLIAIWHIVNLAYTIDAALSDAGAR